jgi:hypothetical protein
MIAKTQPKFPFDQIVATPGALEALQKAGQSAIEFLGRHAHGDWGEVCEEDQQLNDQALIDGSRLLSVYRTSLDEKLWIITGEQKSVVLVVAPRFARSDSPELVSDHEPGMSGSALRKGRQDEWSGH